MVLELTYSPLCSIYAAVVWRRVPKQHIGRGVESRDLAALVPLLRHWNISNTPMYRGKRRQGNRYLYLGTFQRECVAPLKDGSRRYSF